MPTPEGTRDRLRVLLRDRGGDPPVEVALALREYAGAAAEPAALLAELAADPELAPRLRAVALLAVAILLTDRPDAAAPEAALDAVDDPETAAAAIEQGLAGALTGVLLAAPCEGSLQATRRMIGRRCLAAGQLGPHITRLLLDGGDREGAGRAAAADLLDSLARGPGDARAQASLLLLLEWSADEEFLAMVVRELEAADATAPARLEAGMAALAAGPEQVAAVRARIGRARSQLA